MPDIFMIFGVPIALNASLAVLFGVVFLAGVIRGFMGFGSALLIVPALAVLYGPAQAVVIEVLIEVAVTIGLMPAVIGKADRRAVVPMLAMFALFVPLGALLLKVMDPEPMKIGISLCVLAMVGVVAFQRRLASVLTPTGVLITGAASGVAQGMTGMAGPLFATAILARGESADVTRANILGASAGIIALSALSFWMFGLMTLETVVYALIATPAVLIGGVIGAQLFRRFSHLNLRAIILSFLAVTALYTLVRTIS